MIWAVSLLLGEGGKGGDGDGRRDGGRFYGRGGLVGGGFQMGEVDIAGSGSLPRVWIIV